MDKQVIYAWIVSGVAAGLLCHLATKAIVSRFKIESMGRRIAIGFGLNLLAIFLLNGFTAFAWLPPYGASTMAGRGAAFFLTAAAIILSFAYAW
jgi:hypothetical protein